MSVESDKRLRSLYSEGPKLLVEPLLGGEQLGVETNVQVEELLTLLEMASGSTLIISICNPPALRKKIVGYLRERLSGFGVWIYDVNVTKRDEHVVKLLKGIEDSGKFRRFEKKYRSVVLSVMGIENVFMGGRSKVSKFYQNLNLYRDFFVLSRHAVLFWVNEVVASEIGITAPDFWRARTKVVNFRSREEMIVESLEQLAGMPIFYKDWEDIKRREMVHERLLRSLDPDSPKDKRSYAMIAFGLGILKYVQGNYDEAKRLYEDSLKIDTDLGDRSGIATSLHQMANIEYLRGNYDEAKRLYEDSLKIKRELGDRSGIAATLHQMANIEYLRGNYDEAKRLYEENLDIFKDLGDRSGIAKSLHQMAMIEQDKGNYDEAKRLYEDSLKIDTDLGDRSGIAMTMGALGILFEKREQFENALKYFLNTAYLFHQIGSPHEKQALREIARTAQKLGEERSNRTMEEMPDEIKAYLRQTTTKPPNPAP